MKNKCEHALKETFIEDGFYIIQCEQCGAELNSVSLKEIQEVIGFSEDEYEG